MIRIITDSAADFSQSELQALSVRCVPMTVSFGEDSYTDGVDLPQEIFWQRMEAGQNPKTSQPSPDAFLREFEAAKDAGDSVVCILISSALSGTMQSALIAAGMVEDLDIALVDSLTATAGQRLLVQEACRLRYPILPLYTAGRENCIAFLRQAAQAGYACTIDDAISVGPTIGAHVGPGVFGLAYVSAQA